ncbi:MAG: CHASE2 domain-containing protein [Oculatellaceae cyanobacterium bins.114]|nr:CHASE2 domain-containing protein [Oculatellaceae cyanobacterium bins.114]
MWTQRLKRLEQWRNIGITAVAVSCLTIGLRLTGGLQILEWTVLDWFFQHRALEEPDSRIVLVTIEEADITRLQQWPISDATLAEALQRIKQQQPRVIGLDLYRDLPVEPGHAQLLDVFRSTPNLIGIEKVTSGSEGGAIAPPPVLSERGQVSASDLVLDDDGTLRRVLLSLDNADGETVLGLASRLALIYLKTEGIQLEPINRDRGHVRLGKAEFLRLQANDGGYVRADVGGYQILSNFRHFKQEFTQVSLSELLEGQVPADLMRDRIVLIGTTAASVSDRLNAPRIDNTDNLPGVPGVMIHADIISQLLSAALEGRPVLKTWSEPGEWVWIGVWAVVGSWLGWRLQSPLRTGIGASLLSGGLGVTTYIFFLQGWWVPLVPGVISLLGSAVVSKSYLLWSHLLQSKQQLEEYASTLEQRVDERTRELNEKNRQLEQAKEAAEAAARAKSRFLATMSHELRTPLNSIIGFSELLLEDISVEAPEHRQVNIIYQSSSHLLNLINDVLTMSKIESGRTSLNLDCFDLHACVDNLIQMFRQQTDSKQLQLRCDRSADVPQLVTADEGKLRQVLLNLLSNAVKFTEQGEVILRVKLPDETGKALDEPNPSTAQPHVLLFEVEDTGCGVAETELDKLFQPFEQTEAGRRSQQGTGLGLAISREFIRLMGGDISVQSQVNVGTTFRFSIPVQVGDLSEREEIFHHQVRVATEQPKYRILIAEDNVVNRTLLIYILASAGFQVQVAENGEAAIQLWKTWHPHLIFMDMNMPVMDGYEATRQIRAIETSDLSAQSNSAQASQRLTPSEEPLSPLTLTGYNGHSNSSDAALSLPSLSSLQNSTLSATHPQHPRTVIIALTAHMFEEEKQAAIAAGCDDLLSKPFKKELLYQTITKYLQVNYVAIDKKVESPS